MNWINYRCLWRNLIGISERIMKFGVEMVVLWRWSEKLVTVVYSGWRWSEKLVRVVVTVATDQELIIELWYHVDNNELRESHISHTHTRVKVISLSWNEWGYRVYIQGKTNNRIFTLLVLQLSNCNTSVPELLTNSSLTNRIKTKKRSYLWNNYSVQNHLLDNT